MFYKGGGPSCGSPARSRRSRPPYDTRRRAPGARACRAHLSKCFRLRPPGTDIFAVERRTVARRRRTRPTFPAGARSTSRTPRVDRRKCGRSGVGSGLSERGWPTERRARLALAATRGGTGAAVALNAGASARRRWWRQVLPPVLLARAATTPTSASRSSFMASGRAPTAPRARPRIRRGAQRKTDQARQFLFDDH